MQFGFIFLSRKINRYIEKIRSGYYLGMSLMISLILKDSGIAVGGGLIVYGRPLIKRHPSSSISIGARVVLCSDSRYTALALSQVVKISTIRPGAVIEIGDDVGISGACVIAAQSIFIGEQVLMGANVLIVDTDFHTIDPVRRRFNDAPNQIGCAQVRIETNVFIGTRATVLKGVTIGRDSVVAAGAVVVSGTYPDGCVLAGNPARVIGSVYKK